MDKATTKVATNTRTQPTGIRIRRASFQNFRCFSEAQFILPDHCTVIGANNAGKTALAEGIALALGRDRLMRQIDDYDFHKGFLNVDDPLRARFLIKLLLVGIPHDDPVNKGKWINWNEGGTALWWDDEESKLVDEPQEDLVGKRYLLATEIACCGFFDEENCEYQVVRYFVDGDCDPAAGDPHTPVKQNLLRELGLFLLPAQRTWDRTLTFSASTFIKLLRESDAIPGSIVTNLRRALAEIKPAPEADAGFRGIIESVTDELRRAAMVPAKAKIEYRPTALDVRSILTSLVPNVKMEEGNRIPLGAQGSGLLAIQNLLLLIEFARRRKEQGQNFIFVVEEPELHLFPNLQLRITQLVREFSTQSIVTTHSPAVAGANHPQEVIVIRNDSGVAKAEPLLARTQEHQNKHLTRSYFYEDRVDFLSAVMGNVAVLPEGKLDTNWLRLLQRLAVRYEADQPDNSITLSSASTISFIKTRDSQILRTLDEMKRLFCDPLVLLDGDSEGQRNAREVSDRGHKKIARWNDNAEIEDIVAWVLEPGLREGTAEVFEPLDIAALSTQKELARALKRVKKDVVVHEELIERMASCAAVRERAWKLICDIADLAQGVAPTRLIWYHDKLVPDCQVFGESIQSN